MESISYRERISLYLKYNPGLSMSQVGTLLLIDNIYKQVPEDMEEFRELYAHLDPKIIDNSAEGITFLKIAGMDDLPEQIKKRLNDYINIKYNYIGNSKSYERNMKRFRAYSLQVSNVLSEILAIAKLPDEVLETLKEKEQIRGCDDFYDLFLLYRETKDKRVKFEILRKIGIMVLLSRITRSFLIEDVEFAMESVKEVFKKGLGLSRKGSRKYYFWLGSEDKLVFLDDKDKAKSMYEHDVKKRQELALETYPLQEIECHEYDTRYGSRILHIGKRNKLMKDGKIYYASFIEKVIRKNLEFPNQITDLMGVKIIVQDEERVPRMIKEIETVLGGSSTRKKEKNALHRFGKKKLGRYSSKDYYVWKAIYDIALPHPSISQVKQMIGMTRGNKKAQEALRKRLEYFRNKPHDYVVEVQIQSIESYLLSKTHGSPTEHSNLKKSQVRSSSFFKLFPKEIYESELINLRRSILKEKENLKK